ncbi:MAG: carboxypeptidase regulatory-like domain-containing protein, partial [Bacteroidaceae bacterium]|nr:carboxypeptidase regulatory-like domain-containing protein [Bacteroidaceae bacterium]
DLITINLAEPIVYDGNALRFVVRSEGTTYKSGTYFEVTNTSGNGKSYYNRNDNANTFTNSQTWSQNSYVPAIHFGLKAEAKTLSGVVTDNGGNPLEGATVTIRNAENDIEYFATTDETGAYTINVVQNSLTYTATVTAEGYETLVDDEELDFIEGNRTKDFVLTKLTVSLTISSVEYATFYYSNSAYKIPEGLEAFAVESIHGNNLTLISIPGIIPAGCGVIIKGPQGTYDMEATSEEGVAVENLLLGFDVPHLTEGGDIYYKLTVKNGKVGFYWGEENGGAFENAAHKAYLALPADQYNGVNFFTFDNDNGNATGIDNATGSIETDTQEADRVYNLSGQRVNDSYKGVVIVNGKKVMRK